MCIGPCIILIIEE